MIKNLLCLVCASIICVGCASMETVDISAGGKAGRVGPKVLRHVVLFKFKDNATAEQVRVVEKAFSSLPSRINAIYDFEWGTDISVEDRAQGYTHCFLVTFLSESDRDEYLPHPAHREFAATLRPYLDKVLVLDYWTSR